MNFPIFAGAAACAAPADRVRVNLPRGPPEIPRAELESFRSTMEAMVGQVRAAVIQRGGEIVDHPAVVDAEIALHEQRQRAFAEKISAIREEEASLSLRLRRDQLRSRVEFEEIFERPAPVVSVAVPVVIEAPVSVPIVIEKKEPIATVEVSVQASPDISAAIAPPKLVRAPRSSSLLKPTAATTARQVRPAVSAKLLEVPAATAVTSSKLKSTRVKSVGSAASAAATRK